MSSSVIEANGRATNVAMVCLLAIALIRHMILNRSLNLTLSISSALLVFLWFIAFMSISWTPVPDVALQQWSQYWPYMLITVLIVPIIASNHIDVGAALRGLVLLGGVLAVAVDVFVRWENRYVLAFWNPGVQFWNALAFAQMAGYTAITAATLPMRGNSLTVLWRLFVIAACMILAVKSGSRGQFILMVGISVILLPISRRNKNWKAYLAILVLGFCVATASYLAFDYFSGGDERWSVERLDADLEGRTAMAATLFDHWWNAASSNVITFAFGLGNSSSFSPSIVGYYPHIVPVEVLAEEGLIGLIIFILLNVLFVVIAKKSLAESAHNDEQRGVVAALIGMYMFAVLLSFKQGSMLNTSAEMFVFLVILERIHRSRPLSEVRVADKPTGSRTAMVPKYDNLCN